MNWQKTKYEEVPALSVRGHDLRHSLRVVTMAWMFGVVWATCIGGSHINTFANLLGFNNLAFGIMTSLPFAARFVQLLASAMVEKTGAVKGPFLRYASISRILWLAVAAVPLFLTIPSTAAVVACLLMMTLSWGTAMMAVPPWVLWMGKLMPRRIRGRFLARRAQITTLIGVGVALLLGVVMDQVFPHHGEITRESVPSLLAEYPAALPTICIILAVSAVFGTIDIRLFQRIRELLPTDSLPTPEPAPAVQGTWGRRHARAAKALLWDPMRDRTFRFNVIYGATVMFSATVAGPFFWRNAMENIGFNSLTANTMFLVIGPIASIAGARAWGRAVDRWGRSPVLVISTAVTIFSVVPWFFATKCTGSGLAPMLHLPAGTPVGSYLLGGLACAVGGFSWTGLALAQQGIWFGFTDGPGRRRYVAAYDILCGFGGAVGAFVGGFVAQQLVFLERDPILLGSLLWNNWHVTFALSMLSRIVSTLLAMRIPDPGSTDTWTVVRAIRVNVHNALAAWLFSPVRLVIPRRRRDKNDQAGDSAV
ncbi:MAG: hypothetical protein NT031_18640 [Planctomycetota bacterium]|nr:hypothetical protein [Planctomycetota bacterium]